MPILTLHRFAVLFNPPSSVIIWENLAFIFLSSFLSVKSSVLWCSGYPPNSISAGHESSVQHDKIRMTMRYAQDIFLLLPQYYCNIVGVLLILNHA